MSKRVLVAYASVSGSTGEVAQAIGEVLMEENIAADVRPIADIANLSGYGAVILGSSIRAGKWLPEAFDFLETHGEAMSRMVVAYFTTCLTMVKNTEDNRKTVLAYMEPIFQAAPEIKPIGLGLFAGSLDPNRPLFMQVAGPQGDYRDWEVIRAWAQQISPLLLEGDVALAQPIVLRGAILSYTDMSTADLHAADFHEADLHKADLHEADLHDADLGGADLHWADLHQADLHEASLRWADLNWANMSGADLHGANLLGADLKQANVRQANLTRVILNGADLSEADLREADLRDADLNWTNLSRANLSGANLSGARLGWANLNGANLSGANLSEAKYTRETVWPEGFIPSEQGCILIEGKVH